MLALTRAFCNGLKQERQRKAKLTSARRDALVILELCCALKSSRNTICFGNKDVGACFMEAGKVAECFKPPSNDG